MFKKTFLTRVLKECLDRKEGEIYPLYVLTSLLFLWINILKWITEYKDNFFTLTYEYCSAN